ncbi:MAG TPA: hypothetical protein VGQ07_08305 [Nitrospirales bacterium]|jgi:hypothetical protein|nr:hypothetical protein [Nitrospirales bacterium]
MAWGILMTALTLISMLVLAIVEASTSDVYELVSEKEESEFKKAA